MICVFVFLLSTLFLSHSIIFFLLQKPNWRWCISIWYLVVSSTCVAKTIDLHTLFPHYQCSFPKPHGAFLRYIWGGGLTSLNPVFTLSRTLRWFSNKIIAYNLSFSTPLPCKHSDDRNFHMVPMCHFNIRSEVSNLSLMLMSWNMSRHGGWVLSRGCQLLEGLWVWK